jgi:FkbM family methyltransferase
LAPHDYLLFYPKAIAKNIIIVGGHNGSVVTKYFKNKIIPDNIIIFEPVNEYAMLIEENMRYYRNKFLTDISIINKALYISSEKMHLSLAGDASTFSIHGRQDIIKEQYNTEILVDCFDVSDLDDLLKQKNIKGDITFLFNCEGAEYKIITKMLSNPKRGFTIKSMYIQTHKINNQPYSELYDLRKLLSDDFYPLITYDWAWDIWLQNK